MFTRVRIHDLLERARPGDKLSQRVDVALMSLVVANVVVAIIETLPQHRDGAPWYLAWFDVASFVIFAIEYVLRLWSATAEESYRHPVTGRLRFALRPLMLIDLAVLVLPIWLDLRPLRILRLVRLARYSSRMRLLGRVLEEKREDLLVSLAVALTMLIATSTAMYYVECDDNPAFQSIPETMWWGVATLTTVGYGDVTPVTPTGKILGAVVALIGIGVFALPAGILGGGFADALEQERIKRRAAATAGRCPHCGERLETHGA